MNNSALKKLALTASLLSLLCACKTSSEDRSHLLDVETPNTYSSPTPDGVLSEQGWLADFDDARLQELVAEAQQNNPNLRATAARMRSVAASARATAAGLFPTASGSGGANRNKRSGAAGFRLTNPVNDTFTLNASIAWELDLWGKIQNRTRAATADFEAAAADFEAARLSLAANTVGAWFNAVEAEQQVRLSQQTLKSFQTNLTVIKQGFDRGVNPALDVRLTRANVANARASLHQREQQRDAAIRTLEALLGKYPAKRIEASPDLPRIQREIPVGLPSELLNRRPDILAAERRLAAADERFRAARKDMLPTISLSANGGTLSSELKDILDPDSNVWGFAANLAAPIFQGGRLRAIAKSNQANVEAALANYTQTALNAFREVETALAAGTFLREQEQALRIAAQESSEAEQLAWSEYQRGLVDIITVLDSQRRSFNAHSALIQVSNQRLQNRLNLHLALAGDFESTRVEASSDKQPDDQPES